MLHQAGWIVNVKRVERIWRREGLVHPASAGISQPCLVLRLRRGSYAQPQEIRMLNVIDEFTSECIAIRVERKLKAVDVIDVLSDLFNLRGVPTTFVPTTS